MNFADDKQMTFSKDLANLNCRKSYTRVAIGKV